MLSMIIYWYMEIDFTHPKMLTQHLDVQVEFLYEKPKIKLLFRSRSVWVQYPKDIGIVFLIKMKN